MSASMNLRLEFGHKATVRDVPTKDGRTHDWKVYVKGAEGVSLEHFVERIVFHLHETYEYRHRVVRIAPYEMAESGYAGFDMLIDIYFKNEEESKYVTVEYDLFLGENAPVDEKREEILKFYNPSKDFRRKLLAGGAELSSVSNKPSTGNPNSKQDSVTQEWGFNRLTTKPKCAVLLKEGGRIANAQVALCETRSGTKGGISRSRKVAPESVFNTRKSRKKRCRPKYHEKPDPKAYKDISRSELYSISKENDEPQRSFEAEKRLHQQLNDTSKVCAPSLLLNKLNHRPSSSSSDTLNGKDLQAVFNTRPLSPIARTPWSLLNARDSTLRSKDVGNLALVSTINCHSAKSFWNNNSTSIDEQVRTVEQKDDEVAMVTIGFPSPGKCPDMTWERESELRDLQQKLSKVKDINKLIKIVRIVNQSGNLKQVGEFLDFDLCALEDETIRRLERELYREATPQLNSAHRKDGAFPATKGML